MKKVIICFCILLSVITITGCSKNNNSYLKEITFDELYKMIENKETFILEIMQDGCSHCAVFTPRFKAVLEEYQVEAKALNFTDITDEQYEIFKDDFGSVGTPTVIFFVEGQEKTKINRLTGEVSKNEIIRKLKQNGYIEE